jgi:hypothetical protein
MRRLLIAKEQLYLCQSGPHDSCGIAAKRGIRADVRGKIIAEGKWPEYNLPPGKKKKKRERMHTKGEAQRSKERKNCLLVSTWTESICCL